MPLRSDFERYAPSVARNSGRDSTEQRPRERQRALGVRSATRSAGRSARARFSQQEKIIFSGCILPTGEYHFLQENMIFSSWENTPGEYLIFRRQNPLFSGPEIILEILLLSQNFSHLENLCFSRPEEFLENYKISLIFFHRGRIFVGAWLTYPEPFSHREKRSIPAAPMHELIAAARPWLEPEMAACDQEARRARVAPQLIVGRRYHAANAPHPRKQLGGTGATGNEPQDGPCLRNQRLDFWSRNEWSDVLRSTKAATAIWRTRKNADTMWTYSRETTDPTSTSGVDECRRDPKTAKRGAEAGETKRRPGEVAWSSAVKSTKGGRQNSMKTVDIDRESRRRGAAAI
ncbi:hypothetical protein B0H16DRAFT_1447455 [Mycena metata]|uniref:Uncharacterized protein n=1 Tax=Mycena metata TaxID=1033252 RepID=A0AAD7P0W1_9AGAR|nr:hypothetical protein B0H16DRAFT_1447455 [Mycena metata]